MPLKGFFDRVAVISLDRRPDRWDGFLGRLKDWPFQTPERYRAIDGKTVKHPDWWRAGGGAWGIYRSTVRLLEECLMAGTERLLVLEDDAIPCDGFSEKVARYLDALPQNWEMIYLGGQINHYAAALHRPRVVNPEVIVPWSVNRLHAYGVSRSGMQTIYQHLHARGWQNAHHIDHHIEKLQRAGGLKFYAPTQWLVGQADGKSDICARELPVRFFDKSTPKTSLPKVLAAVGPYRGGTSAVAGAVHQLGISMGNHFFQGTKEASPRGCFEALALYQACMRCYPEPAFQEGQPRKRRVDTLRGWLNGRRGDGRVIGAKHPKLCLMVPEMLEAWPECKFLVVRRPIEESVASLTKLGWWRRRQDPHRLIRRLINTRDKDLENVPKDRVLRIEFADFLADTRGHLEKIAAFAQVAPTEKQYEKAVMHVSPEFKHYGCEELP